MDWIAESASLCREISAPTLDHVGIVVLDADNDPLGAQLLPDGACGLTSPLLSYALSKSGRGSPEDFVTVVSCDRIARGYTDSWSRSFLAINVVLHELAHHLDGLVRKMLHQRQHGRTAVDDSDLDWLTLESLMDVAAKPSRERSLQSTPWFHHEAQFARAAIHIAHRANELKFRTMTSYMRVAGERYGLSPVALYTVHLGDEPRRRRADPIVEVLADDAPVEFAELFAADCRAWQARGAA